MQSNLTLHELLDKLGIPNELCLNVYQTGSRVYGTATEDSDYDFLSDYLEKDNLSCLLFGLNQFLHLLSEYHHATIYCICTPPKYIWKNSYHFDFPSPFSIPLLKSSISRKVGSCFSKALSHSKSGNIIGFKKMIIHGIRYLLISKQIIENGGFLFVDFSVANEYYHDRMLLNNYDCNSIKEKYTKLKNELFLSIFPVRTDDNIKNISENVNSNNENNNSNAIIESLKLSIVTGNVIERKDKLLIIDVIRLDLMNEEDISIELPSFLQFYIQIKSQYDSLCDKIQENYNLIRNSCSDWDDESVSGKAISQLAGKLKSIIFLMKESNIDNIRILFARHNSQKYLELALLHSRTKEGSDL